MSEPNPFEIAPHDADEHHDQPAAVPQSEAQAEAEGEAEEVEVVEEAATAPPPAATPTAEQGHDQKQAQEASLLSLVPAVAVSPAVFVGASHGDHEEVLDQKHEAKHEPVTETEAEHEEHENEGEEEEAEEGHDEALYEREGMSPFIVRVAQVLCAV